MAGLPSGDFETDRAQIAALITNRAPELSPAPDKFAGEQAGALAQVAQSIGGDIDRAAKDAIPSVDSSTEGLTTWGETVGISNGAGGFGPRGATFATGAIAYLTGDAGTAYTAGQQAITAGVTLRLRANVSIPGVSGTGQALGTWDADPTVAASAGVAGNLTAGTVLTLVSPPGTSDPAITLQTGMAVLGQNAESDSSVLTRILNKFQRPPNGGNGSDFRDWAQDATDSAGNPLTTAPLAAYVYRCYDGGGSPMVLVLQSGSGTARAISAQLQSDISLYINGTTAYEGQRPVSFDCRVITGYMPTARALVCRVRCVASKAAYAFDWVRGSTSYVVDTFDTTALPSWATSAGANAVLTLTGLAPSSLKDAITASAQPRLQVDTRNGSTLLGPVVPDALPCLAFQDAAGKTSLGIKVPSATNYAAWVHAGNAVYSGGPIVAPVAGNVLGAIDSRGPSRASGLADPAQLWQDTVGITTLSTAAESTLDADGVTRLVDRCVAGGVLIGIGGAATPTAQDVTASDNTINGPEVLYAGRLLVTD